MKLRYYLRGLGTGIIVTAIIMSFTRQPEKLSDAQIKMRALELGMVEESVLADLQNKKEESHIPAFEDIVNVEEQETTEESDSVIDEQTDTEESNSEGEEQNNIEEDNSAVEEQSNIEEDSFEDEGNIEEVSEENSVATDFDNSFVAISPEEVVENYIIILVESGNGSEVISRRLYEAGLVNSAVEYNKFLVRNGYDRKLKVGNHEIPAGATEEEMAKILCGMR